MQTQLSAYNPTLRQQIEDALGISFDKFIAGAKGTIPFMPKPAVGSEEFDYANSPQGNLARTVGEVGTLFGPSALKALQGVKAYKTAKVASDLAKANQTLPEVTMLPKQVRDLRAAGQALPGTVKMGRSKLASYDPSVLMPGAKTVRSVGYGNVADNFADWWNSPAIIEETPPLETQMEVAPETKKVENPPVTIPETYGVSLAGFEMPQSRGGFSAEGLPAVPQQVPVAQPVQPQVPQSDPFTDALLSLIQNLPAPQTPARPTKSVDEVVAGFNERNPQADPKNKPAFDKILDFIGLSRGPAQINPAEMLRLQAELGLATEGVAGEQGLNRNMRQAEHATAVGAAPNARDYLNFLMGRSNMQAQTGESLKLAQADEASRGRLMEKGASLEATQRETDANRAMRQANSPETRKTTLAGRNPELVPLDQWEQVYGIKMTPEILNWYRTTQEKGMSAQDMMLTQLLQSGKLGGGLNLGALNQ